MAKRQASPSASFASNATTPRSGEAVRTPKKKTEFLKRQRPDAQDQTLHILGGASLLFIDRLLSQVFVFLWSVREKFVLVFLFFLSAIGLPDKPHSSQEVFEREQRGKFSFSLSLCLERLGK